MCLERLKAMGLRSDLIPNKGLNLPGDCAVSAQRLSKFDPASLRLSMQQQLAVAHQYLRWILDVNDTSEGLAAYLLGLTILYCEIQPK